MNILAVLSVYLYSSISGLPKSQTEVGADLNEVLLRVVLITIKSVNHISTARQCLTDNTFPQAVVTSSSAFSITIVFASISPLIQHPFCGGLTES